MPSVLTRSLVLRLAVLFASCLLAVLFIEAAARFYEDRSALQENDSNVGQLFARSAQDAIRVSFFNGCFINAGIMKADPLLGFVNVPDVEGFSIHILGRANLVVKKPYDFLQLEKEGLRFQPSAFRINNLGNRGQDAQLVKPAGIRRLVFLGDSVTFGYYVEDNQTFAEQTALLLSKEHGLNLEAWNAGVSNLNAEHIFNHLRERALAWEPDMVFWCFYVNDILDSFGQEADVLFPVRRLGLLARLRHSALARLLGRAIFSSRAGSFFAVDAEDPRNQQVASSWRKIEANLHQAAFLLKERDAELVVVVFPSAIQFGRAWTRPHYQDKLLQLCRKEGIPCVDILPAFERTAKAQELYWPGDLIHPNAKGHSLAAEEIVRVLEKTRLLERFGKH